MYGGGGGEDIAAVHNLAVDGCGHQGARELLLLDLLRLVVVLLVVVL